MIEKPFKYLGGFFIDIQQDIMLIFFEFSWYLTPYFFAGKGIFITFANL